MLDEITGVTQAQDLPTDMEPRIGETIGVEEEFHLVHPQTGLPSPGSELVLAAAPEAFAVVQQEYQRSMIETATPVCTDLSGLRESLLRSRANLNRAAGVAGLAIAAVGTVPGCGAQRGAVFPDQRYRQISDDYQQLSVEQHVCACQVQIGVPSKELAVRSIRRIRAWLPALLALSTSSPYFAQSDTGYASYRNILITRWPSGGPAPAFSDLADYERRIAALLDTGVINDLGMIYFDVRPSHRYPTLEIRIADACPLVDDVMTIAALSRALVVTAAHAELRDDPPPVIDDEILRAATWRAARSGITGQLIDPLVGRPVRPRELMRRLVAHVSDALAEFGEYELATAGIEDILGRGTSSIRQRRALTNGKSFQGVAASVVAETLTGQPN